MSTKVYQPNAIDSKDVYIVKGYFSDYTYNTSLLKIGDESRILIEFDISDISKDSIIATSSKLEFYVYDEGVEGPCARWTLAPITREWKEACSWNSWDADNRYHWTVAGGDWGSPTITFTGPRSINSYFTITGYDLSLVINDAIQNKSGKFSVLIWSTDDESDGGPNNRIRSSEYGSNTPKLTLDYTSILNLSATLESNTTQSGVLSGNIVCNLGDTPTSLESNTTLSGTLTLLSSALYRSLQAQPSLDKIYARFFHPIATAIEENLIGLFPDLGEVKISSYGSTGNISGLVNYRVTYFISHPRTGKLLAESLYSQSPNLYVSNSQVRVKLPLHSTPGKYITGRKIYRSPDYRLVDTIYDNFTENYIDNKSNDELGALQCPTVDSGTLAILGRGQDLTWFVDPFSSDVFSTSVAGSITIDFPASKDIWITSIYSDQTMYVRGAGGRNIYMNSGNNPAYMQSSWPIPVGVAISGDRNFVSYNPLGYTEISGFFTPRMDTLQPKIYTTTNTTTVTVPDGKKFILLSACFATTYPNNLILTRNSVDTIVLHADTSANTFLGNQPNPVVQPLVFTAGDQLKSSANGCTLTGVEMFDPAYSMVLIPPPGQKSYVNKMALHDSINYQLVSKKITTSVTDKLGIADDTLSTPRNLNNNLWAYQIIGQPSFEEVNANKIVAYKLGSAYGGGCVVDALNNRLYVGDYFNNRVLGFDLDTALTADKPVSADIVIGQKNFNASAGNGDGAWQNYPVTPIPTAKTLRTVDTTQMSAGEAIYPATLCYTTANNVLWISDCNNHRILAYNNSWSNRPAATSAWGQGNFTSGLKNRTGGDTPSSSGLNTWKGGGVAFDSSGSMWALDNWNNRILRFPLSGGVIQPVADLVLGQPNFTARIGGEDGSENARTKDLGTTTTAFTAGLGDSSKTWTTNQWVGSYVGCNGKTMIVSSNSSTALNCTTGWSGGGNPGNAQNYIVMKDLVSTGFVNPSSLCFDSSGNLYVAEYWGFCVSKFTYPIVSGQAGNLFVATRWPSGVTIDPQGNGIWISDQDCAVKLYDFNGAYIKKVVCCLPGGRWGRPMGSIGFDSSYRMYVQLGNGSVCDIVVYNSPYTGYDSYPYTPAYQLTTPPYSVNLLSSSDLSAGMGVAVVDNKLMVNSFDRIYLWNDVNALYTGKPADGVVVPGSNTTDFDVSGPVMYSLKCSENYAYVDCYVDGSYRVIAYPLPLTNGCGAAYSASITSPVSILGSTSTVTFSTNELIYGLCPTANDAFLWLGLRDTNRVVRVRNPLTAPMIDIILGQPDSTSTTENTGGISKSTLSHPGKISIDRLGNLWVADHCLEDVGNKRMLMWASSAIPTANTTPQYGIAATKEITTVTNEYGSTHTAAAFEMAFDSSNRMVVGFNGYDPTCSFFPAIYNNPCVAGDNTQPDAHLKDYFTMAYGVCFDDNNTLYVSELTHARALRYKTPLVAGSGQHRSRVAKVGIKDSVTKKLYPIDREFITERFALSSTVQNYGGYTAAVKALNPGAYWRMNEASGDLIDFSSHGTTATAVGTGKTYGVTGALLKEPSKAITFPGSDNDYFSAPASTSIAASDVFSIVAWTKKNANGSYMNIVCQKSGGYQFRFTDSNTLCLVEAGVGPVVESTISITDTNWHMVAVTKNGAASCKLYIDAVDRTGAVTDRTITSPSDVTFIGRNPTYTNESWNGSLDEVAIFLTALSSAQITALYNAAV